MTPPNTQGSEQALPNPNEVMDVEPLDTQTMIERFANDHGIRYTHWKYDQRKLVVRYIRNTSSNSEISHEVTIVPAFIVRQHFSVVAQQNAALLRELQQHDTIYHYQRGVGEGFFHAIPASILEAKLNELDTTEEVI